MNTAKLDGTRSAKQGPEEWRRRNREVMSLALAWLRSALGAAIAGLRKSRPSEDLRAVGPVVSDLAADWLLRGPAIALPEAEADAAKRARDAFLAAREQMSAGGASSGLDILSHLFSLSRFEEDMLLLALAPKLDGAFGALYGYAHDRAAMTAATPWLAVRLFAGDDTEAAFRALSPEMPLRRFSLIVSDTDSLDALSPLIVDERVVRFLMGDETSDARIRKVMMPVAAALVPERHECHVKGLIAEAQGLQRPVVSLVGPAGSGRRAIGAHLARHIGLSLLEARPRAFAEALRTGTVTPGLLAREAMLGAFGVAIDLDAGASAETEESRQERREAIARLVEDCETVLVLISRERPELPWPVAEAKVPLLEPQDRRALWTRALADRAPALGREIDEVAEQFRLSPSAIATIAARQADAPADTLWRACRSFASHGLDDLAENVPPRFDWDDIVLSEAVREGLQAIVAQVRKRAEVYGRWGFGRKLVRNRGVSALFAGPSGVGKTMAAEVIANELELDLYRIDLSGVVSKYIGETEKNLRRVFDAAEASGAVLFFDEADALFGKRSEVKDSHDRYANIEVSYLLQRMETYTGLAILATNLKANLDAAFLRRLRHVIDFPFPDAAQRREIWQRVLPPEAPTADLDLDALARLEVAGGNIAVIAVNAAFLAADEGVPIAMTHIAKATRAELRKLDKELRVPWR